METILLCSGAQHCRHRLGAAGRSCVALSALPDWEGLARDGGGGH